MRLRFIPFLILILSSICLLFPVADLRINLSPSVPWVMVRIQPLPKATETLRGKLVLACPLNDTIQQTAKTRGYIHWGWHCAGYFTPLLKYVVAVPGDIVTPTEQGIVINGQLLVNSNPLNHDSAQHLLPFPPIGGVVPPDRVWLLSTDHKGSWDSRYWGAIPLEQLQGLAMPMLTHWRYTAE